MKITKSKTKKKFIAVTLKTLIEYDSQTGFDEAVEDLRRRGIFMDRSSYGQNGFHHVKTVEVTDIDLEPDYQ